MNLDAEDDAVLTVTVPPTPKPQVMEEFKGHMMPGANEVPADVWPRVMTTRAREILAQAFADRLRAAPQLKDFAVQAGDGNHHLLLSLGKKPLLTVMVSVDRAYYVSTGIVVQLNPHRSDGSRKLPERRFHVERRSVTKAEVLPYSKGSPVEVGLKAPWAKLWTAVLKMAENRRKQVEDERRTEEAIRNEDVMRKAALRPVKAALSRVQVDGDARVFSTRLGLRGQMGAYSLIVRAEKLDAQLARQLLVDLPAGVRVRLEVEHLTAEDAVKVLERLPQGPPADRWDSIDTTEDE